jgi:hypothetical protein
MPSNENLIGDVLIPPTFFPKIEEKIADFRAKTFHELSSRHRFRLINSLLLSLIQEAKEGVFLLPAIVDYIRRINQLGVYEESYNFSHFEFWLNLFSELSPEEKQSIRGKIVGKMIPRDSYQLFFPIGMQKSYSGSHFIAAHLSPDTDTTIASFWGWVDAFGARVGEALHLWCLPGGPADATITRHFKNIFGDGFFAATARTSKTLSLTAQDLLTQKGMIKTKGHISTYELDHGESEKALVYVDEEGNYLGDWRAEDVEIVRQVGNAFKGLLHAFENGFDIGIITLFSKENLKVFDFPPFLKSVFEAKLKESSIIQELDAKGKERFLLLLEQVLDLKNGDATFANLFIALGSFGIEEAALFQREVESLPSSSLFNAEGFLIENRTAIFHTLERLIELLDITIRKGRGLVDRLDIVMKIKEKVLKITSPYLSMKSDVEEIRQKMRHYNSLTVVIPEQGGRLFPVGIVKASDLRKETLGTVSLRDFSNFLEVQMAPYLQVISVIDHHKIDLKTLSQPQIVMGDAQSCNVLVAEIAFQINDNYSLGGMSKESIEKEIESLRAKELTPLNIRLLKRLLKRKSAADQRGYWISKEREYSEYLSFMIAILDDTDLLSKVSDRDVVVVASLLNRMKSLLLGKEVEIIDLSDLPKDEKFAKKSAKKILEHPDMYSIYKKIYSFKEEEVEESMRLEAEGLPSTFFGDTKEQNGCCRVGQTKLFASNFKSYQQHQEALKAKWVKEAEERYKNQPSIDLFLHMVSTVPSAESVFNEGESLQYTHSDEIWFWIPGTSESELHLSRFLSGFRGSKEAKNNKFSLEILGGLASIYEELFKRDFLPCPIEKKATTTLPIAVLKFLPGSVNSRKSAITPFLPRQI